MAENVKSAGPGGRGREIVLARSMEYFRRDCYDFQLEQGQIFMEDDQGVTCQSRVKVESQADG